MGENPNKHMARRTAKKAARKKVTKKKASKKKASAKKVSSKQAPAKNATTGRTATGKLDELDKKTVALIESTAQRVRKSIDGRILPELRFPVRSLSNVKYEKATGYFQLGKGRKGRKVRVRAVADAVYGYSAARSKTRRG